MIRCTQSGFRSLCLVAVLAAAGSSHSTVAQTSTGASKPGGAAKPVQTAKAAQKSNSDKTAAKTDQPSGKPVLVASFGDWGAYAAQSGKSKTCYALAQPTDRSPADEKRDPAYIFISTRPAENVRNEVSIIMGFNVKDGSDAKQISSKSANVQEAFAEVGPMKFIMVAKGSNLWLKNAAEEGPMIEAMRKSGKLIVKAASLKGRVTTDDYSLSGLAQALDRVEKECQ